MALKKKVWLSWSSGKDCSYTLHTLRQREDVEVVGLLTTINETADRVAMHAVRTVLLRAQAAATGISVHEVPLPSPCTNEEYQARMSAAINAARAAKVDAIAFGDLFLQDVRAYREKMMADTGIGTMFPIWLADSSNSTAQLAEQMIDAGFKAVVTCVDPKRLHRSFAGRIWNKAFLQDLPKGVDPCGENGEFHTFVFDGPVFSKPVSIIVGEVIEKDSFVFCDILPGGLSPEEVAREAEAAHAAARTGTAAHGHPQTAGQQQRSGIEICIGSGTAVKAASTANDADGQATTVTGADALAVPAA